MSKRYRRYSDRQEIYSVTGERIPITVQDIEAERAAMIKDLKRFVRHDICSYIRPITDLDLSMLPNIGEVAEAKEKWTCALILFPGTPQHVRKHTNMLGEGARYAAVLKEVEGAICYQICFLTKEQESIISPLVTVFNCYGEVVNSVIKTQHLE